MKLIILCGGLGTRLRSVIGEKQKTMASVKGEPFLKILIDKYKKMGINDFIFACGYKKEEIEDYFKDGKDFGINCYYAVEEYPLGTAGAIRNCLNYIDEDMVYVINGDTLYDFDLTLLNKNMIHFNTEMSIATKNANEEQRYGFIDYDTYDELNGGLIKTFNEKNDKSLYNNKPKIINAGIYLIKKSLIATIPKTNCSIELDIIPKWLNENIKIGFMNGDKDFIDIGTEDSYKKINSYE